MVALKKECQVGGDIVANYRHVFESRISVGAKENPPTRVSGKLAGQTINFLKVTRKKCVERYCEFANKTTQQLYKVATPSCMDDNQLKEEENKSEGELSAVSSQIVLTCLYLVRIGRPDILWSVNKLARAVSKWQNLVTNAWRV